MDALQYSRVIHMAISSPWAITPDKMALITDFLTDRAAGIRYDADEIADRLGGQAAAPRGVSQRGDVAVIPLFGTIVPRASLGVQMSGGTSAEQFAATIAQAANNPTIGSIVIDVDSPGGSAQGIIEAASAVRAARAKKPVLAVANHTAASAAYWIASQASEFSATPSGLVGSIGVFNIHEDISAALELKGVRPTIVSAGKHKVDLNPFGPLNDAGREQLQARADEIYQAFTADVARGRRVSAREVRAGFGEGRVVSADQAKSLGMVDRVETFDEALDRALRGRVGSGGARAEGPAWGVSEYEDGGRRRHNDSNDDEGDEDAAAAAAPPAPAIDKQGLVAALRNALRSEGG